MHLNSSVVTVMVLLALGASADTHQQLAVYRQQIDSLDQRIVKLIQERARVVEQIGELKREAHFPVVVPSREQQVIKKAEDLAKTGPVPAKTAAFIKSWCKKCAIGENIGYARVSTETQNGNGQVAELKKVCDEVHLEYASGGRWDRPCLQNVRFGSELRVSSLLPQAKPAALFSPPDPSTPRSNKRCWLSRSNSLPTARCE